MSIKKPTLSIVRLAFVLFTRFLSIDRARGRIDQSFYRMVAPKVCLKWRNAHSCPCSSKLATARSGIIN